MWIIKFFQGPTVDFQTVNLESSLNLSDEHKNKFTIQSGIFKPQTIISTVDPFISAPSKLKNFREKILARLVSK